MSSTMVMGEHTRENINPSPGVASPASKKAKTTDVSPMKDQQPQILTYEKSAVDAFIAHFRAAIERAETETTYWATLYEESQKEVSDLREKLRALEHKGDEADYLDEEGIPEGPGIHRSGRPSIGNKAAKYEDDPYDAPPAASGSSILAPQRWLSFRNVVKNAVSSVVHGNEHNDK